MATRIFYNSNANGTINAQVTSGQVGAFFSSLTTVERLNGDTELAKIWIESDTTETVFIGVAEGDYDSFLFVSANEADAEGDLLGTEYLYTEYEVISATDTYIIVTDDGNLRANDYLISNGELYKIDTVTDMLDGTYKLEFAMATGAISAGDKVSTAFALNLISDTPKPFWAKEVVSAGSPRYASYTSSNIIVGN
jgi:hypothetical protein